MTENNKRGPRMQITLSAPMRIALEHLAARSGLGVSTQATMLLRQALARTLDSQDVRDAIARYNADRGARAWKEDQQVDHYVETRYEETKGSLPSDGE